MLVQTQRFGPIEVPEGKLIHLQKPILGFEDLSVFFLVEQDDFRPFMWLQSAEHEDLAFIVINPVLVYPDYRIEVHSKEVGDLCITRLEAVETYVIVTVPERPEDVSVNLQGPIVINTENNFAKQLVLVNSRYSVRHRLLDTVGTAEEARTTVEEPLGV
jgi:flagellar assembly factor FliW